MKVPFNDLYNQYLLHKDAFDEAIGNVIKDSAFISGKYAARFEREFESHYGVNCCIGVGNGTDAIYIVLKMLGITEGDEVITTSHSWISTSEAISQVGATPVFVDVDEYFTIDVSKIEAKINSKTKAIIPVHLYGHPADMETILSIAEKNKIWVIEDCAQAHYATINGKRIGTFGLAATFSFYPGKNLGAFGDAGGIVTNNDEFARKCRTFANHGAPVKHQHEMEGINSRLDGIQGAILSEKLKHINKWTEDRIRIAALYNTLLADCNSIKTPSVRTGCTHVYHLYVILAPQRDQLKTYLESKGIACVIHYPSVLPLLDAYKYLDISASDFSKSIANQSSILSLPIYPEMNDEQVAYVCDSIKSFYSK